MPAARVLVLYNEPTLSADHADAESEHEILYTTDVVRRELEEAGFEVATLGASRDPAVLVSGVRDANPDVVFNLFEGTAEHPDTEAFAAGILEWLGLPFTGSPFQTLTLARGKHLTKHLLRGAGIPTAEFFVTDGQHIPTVELQWPVIVKPATQDASVGLDQGSVVTSQDAMRKRVAYLVEKYGPPVLVEEFIEGRELIVGVIEAPELQALPVAEILFEGKRPDFWPIVTYDAKWVPGSEDYEATPPRYPAEVAPKLGQRLQDIAKQAFRLLGCRDYARVDYRVRRNGRPYVLEVNPNPDFSPDAGLSGGLKAQGLTHAEFTVQLVMNALARGRQMRQQLPVS